MKKIKFRFRDVNEVAKFVDICYKQDFDINLESGKVHVDAKSILGVMNIANYENIALEIVCNDYDKVKSFMDSIEPYIERVES